MGFDLYGLAPDNPNNLKAPSLDWSRSDITEDEKTEYFKASDEHRKNVRGEYFSVHLDSRRPIWNFTCNACDNILTRNDMESGHSNDYHKISKTKAKRIATRLKKTIQNGSAQKYEDDTKARSKIAKVRNDEINAALKIVENEAKRVTKNQNLAPCDFPKQYKDKWDEIYAKRSWDSSYPFEVKFLQEFIEFCESSGGFEIG